MATTALPMPAEQEAQPSGQFDETDELDLLKNNIPAQNAVKDVCRYFLGLDKWVRRQEVIETRRQRFYWRSDQYIYWKNDAVGFIPAVAGQTMTVNNESVSVGRYVDVYNIYTPYGESLLSTLIQNPPGVNWQPKDPSKAEDVIARKTAEKFQQRIEDQNDRKNLQAEVARFFYTDGRTILYNYRKDGVEKIRSFGVLESKVVPITANCLDELVFLSLSDEMDIFKAKGEYPEYAPKIKENMSTLGESAYERIARLGVLQGTRLLMQAGDAFAHMVSRHVCFLRDCAFDKLPEGEIRDLVKAKFPDGMKVTFVGDQYCSSENIPMEDQVTVAWPGPGDGMSRPSMGKRMIPLQDVFNDELNLWHEAHDYCVPTLFMYSETGDIEAINEQISQPGNIIPFSALPPGANSAADAFYAAALEAIPPTLPNLIQFIQGPLAQFISGAFPALFGGDTGDNDTAKGIAIQRDQAMGRMGLPWGALQQLFAGAYTNAVKSAVKHAPEDETFSYSYKDASGAVVTEQISYADLKGGNAICKADTDASFPESTNSKRQAYQTLMAASERNPILASVMSDPNNQEYGHMIIGLPDLTVPGAESRNKQLIEISQLLKEPPIPPTMEEIQMAAVQQAASGNNQLMMSMAEWEKNKIGPDGNPTPPPIPKEMYHSSIPVDVPFDNHEMELQTLKDWLSSEDRRREEEDKGNTQGILNVRLHGLEHLKALQALQPPAPVEPPSTAKNRGPQHAGATLAAAPTAH